MSDYDDELEYDFLYNDGVFQDKYPRGFDKKYHFDSMSIRPPIFKSEKASMTYAFTKLNIPNMHIEYIVHIIYEYLCSEVERLWNTRFANDDYSLYRWIEYRYYFKTPIKKQIDKFLEDEVISNTTLRDVFKNELIDRIVARPDAFVSSFYFHYARDYIHYTTMYKKQHDIDENTDYLFYYIDKCISKEPSCIKHKDRIWPCSCNHIFYLFTDKLELIIQDLSVLKPFIPRELHPKGPISESYAKSRARYTTEGYLIHRDK